MAFAGEPVIRSLVVQPDMKELENVRRFAADAAGVAGFEKSQVFDIMLASSEAAANAVEHTPVKGEVTVKTLLYPDRLEIQILGPGEFQAPHRLRNGRSHRGLGLPLMAQLSDHLALYSGPAGGTMVSLTFYRPGARPASEETMPPSIQALVEENEFVRAITGNAPVGLVVLDPDMRFKWTNPAYREFMEEPYRSQDLVGLHVADVVAGLADTTGVEELRQASRTGRAVAPVERELRRRTGEPKWWRRTVVPLTAGAAEPPYDILVVVTDETERILAEQALRASERELRTILDNSRDGINMLDLESGRYVFMSPAQVELTGFSLEEMNGISAEEAAERVHPDDRWISLEQQRRVAAGEDLEEPVEYRWRIKSGEYHWFSDKRKLVRDETGRPVALVGISRDITEERKVQEESRQRMEALRQSEERYRHLVDHAPAPVYQIDFRGPNFVSVNDEMCERTGYSREELMRMSPFDLLDEESRVRFRRRIEQAAAGEVLDETVEYTALTKDGRRRMVVLDVSFTWEEGRPVGAVVVGHDVTDRNRAEEPLHASELRYRELFDSIDEGYLVMELVRDDHGRVVDMYMVEANPAATRLLGEDFTGRYLRQTLPARGEDWYKLAEEVARTGESVRRRKSLGPTGRCYESLFFRVGGPRSNRVGNVFTDVTEEVRTEQNLRFLTDVDTVLSAGLSPDEVVTRVGAMLGEYLKVDNLLLAEASRQDSRAKVLHAWRRGLAVELLETYTLDELNGPEYWQAMLSGQPYVVSDTAADPRTDGRKHLEFGVAAFIVIPFDREGQWKYLVSVDSATAREWNPADTNLVREVAGRIVARVERAQAEEELRVSREQLARDVAGLRGLYELQNKLAQQTDLRAALSDIVALAATSVGAERGIVQVRSAEGEGLEIVAHHGYAADDPFVAHFRLVGLDHVFAAARVRKQRLIIEDVAAFPPLAGTEDREVALAANVRATQSTPLISHTGEVLGVLSTQFSLPHRPSEQELKYMDMLGWTAAEFITRHRAWLERAKAEDELRAREESYRLLAEENERLYRQQLNIAEHLQQALLHIPSEIGRVRLGHLYRSATEAARVGGDFYDVFEAKEGNIAILMGDVAGHGIQAARTGTLVKDVVHAFTHQSLRTHEVLRRTNLLLIEKDLPEFVTLFLGILDPDTGLLRYASAGHPESMVRRVSGEIEMLGCGTSPLGIYPDASWKPREIELQPGDLLLLYTDGVTEARRGTELFGEKRLERLLKRKRISPGRLPHMVLDQVLAFSGGALRDDVAVLVLSLTEPPEGTPARPLPAQQKLLDV